jgi:hypothetical protein
MLGLSSPAAARGSGPTDPGRTQDTYRRYGAALYRQALLNLDDSALAEQVVCDVIVEECASTPQSAHDEDDARYRLAESVVRHCQQAAAVPAERDRRYPGRPARAVADWIDPGRLLSQYEREALGLVLFGGLGYDRAGRALGIAPREMAVLLRAVLLRLATSSAAVEGDSQE